MPTEIEAKFSVPSHEPIRDRLRSLDATFIEKVLETNTLFDRPDGYLRKQGCGLRIRTTENQDDHTARCILTYKGPRKPGAIKSREEIEVETNDAKATQYIINKMGFVEILWYQKLRESWRLNDCRIELDQPPEIGLFVEIEGPNEDVIRRIQADIGLGESQTLQETYVHMLLEYAQQQSISSLRFALG